MATQTRRVRTTKPAADRHDPDGGHGKIHDQLTVAVAEAARLLDADGAMVYLLDPATGILRFAHDSGIRSERSRQWVRTIKLPIGTGLFGRAVEERSVVSTDDYLADPAITHADVTDRVVDDIGIRSMVAAPLVDGDTVFGALGAFSARRAAFSESQIALVRTLAQHAAAAMANTRLIAALAQSQTELAERAEVERSLREIAARISASSDLPAVLQRAVDEAARLLKADGARIDLVDPDTRMLRWAYASGDVRPSEDEWPDDPNETLEEGVSGQAVVGAQPVWTGDYLNDQRFPHGIGGDTYVSRTGIQSVLAAPLRGDRGAFGALTVFTDRPDAWHEADAALLVAIADQAAITITTTRLIAELGRSREALGRRAAGEQSLREIAARITVLRDPSEILQDVVAHAKRLVHADGVILDLLDERTGDLHWAFDDGLAAQFTDDERALLWISVGVGATGTAVAEDRVVVAGDDLAAQFPPSPESTAFYERTGFHSMIAAPITGENGPLGVIEVYAKAVDAFTEVDAGLVGALASQAAISITNARLVSELARSQTELSKAADAERTLREMAARVSAMRDQEEILQSVIAAAARLLEATGVTIDLIDREGMAESWMPGALDGALEKAVDDDMPVDPEAGVSGLAITGRRVEWTDDYLADPRFRHTPDRDAFVRATATKSVIAAPVVHRDTVLGVINAYSDQAAAFDDADAARLGALADQTAVAIANARLIEDLERSRAEIARRGDAERTLREIAVRVSAILEPAEVLQRIVDEAARLLDSDGARIDQYDPEADVLRWAYAAGEAMAVVPGWALSGGLRPGQAVAGLAFAERRAVLTTDYLIDPRFDHQPEIDAFIVETGIRAVMSTPLSAEAGPIGTISVVSRQPGAYDESDLEILTALAAQASVALRNARLMEELARSRDVNERRAEAEHALREIATRITAIREPGDLLQRIVGEAFRLLRADGAVIDEFDPARGLLVSAYDAGLTDEQRETVRSQRLHLGEGLAGRAMLEGRVIAAGDYLAGEFEHIDAWDQLARKTGIGDLIVAPIIGDAGPLGAIEVYRHERHAFDDIDEAVLGGLADQAAIAITNAHLIMELERSRQSVARRADTERSLRDITAAITALHEPDAILARVVEEAKRLLATDDAHLTRMAESGTYLVPVVVAGDADDATAAWLMTMEFPLGDGINGLAAGLREPVWTRDYLADDRVPHEPEDIEVAERLRLRGMAAAPLRAPGGDVIGTLAVSSAEPRVFEAEELDLLQGLADQAAIAITNSTLLERLSASEERYRYLVENTPDLVWSVGPDARLTFLSDAVERMTGRSAEDLLGQHFGVLLHESSRDVAEMDWTEGLEGEVQELRGRLNLLGQDGEPIPAEFVATTRLGEGGRFIGANGSVRDMRDRDRLERELRDSETRYRFLVENSPDVVFSIDADGRFTFLSEAIEGLTGWHPDEIVGNHFSMLVSPETLGQAGAGWERLVADPSVQQVVEIDLLGKGGRRTPAEVHSIGITDAGGRFSGIHGSTRDTSERNRLQRELRRQAGELAAGEERAHLARELHDSVTQALFSMSLVSRSVEMLLDRDPEAARTHLAQLRDLQREALAEMRALIFELRPGNLEQDGLTRALKTHTAALQGRIGLPVVVESDLTDRLPLQVEETLYRIAQEALHNVVKHAAAHQVRVEIGRVPGAIRMRVTDDGTGFDPRRIPEGHLGIAGMQARAARIGASFVCRSEPGQGTTIEVQVADALAVAPGTGPDGVPSGREPTASIRDR